MKRYYLVLAMEIADGFRVTTGALWSLYEARGECLHITP
jgi:hypothetical protein